MENCLLSIRHADGTTAAQGENVLYYAEEYLPGDTIVLRVPRPGYYVICLDDAMGEEFVWMNGAAFNLAVPFGEGRVSYSPRAFVGIDHYLTARPAHAEEIACPRNLARNVYDCHGNAACWPHATANVETRGESVFAARNAIDGVVYPWCHGHYPFQSWGINRDPNACWTLEFGRPVKAGMLALTTRADFPHDAWWTSARLTLSDGESMTLQLEKAPDGHRQCLDLHGVTITGLALDNLKKADDPSPFPALTQVEVWGTNL